MIKKLNVLRVKYFKWRIQEIQSENKYYMENYIEDGLGTDLFDIYEPLYTKNSNKIEKLENKKNKLELALK